MRAFKTFFTRTYLAAGGTEPADPRTRPGKNERALWQPRFWEHTIRDAKDFKRRADYVHYNPVQHGLVVDPADWPWTSFHRYLKKQWYPLGWGRTAPESIADMDDTGE